MDGTAHTVQGAHAPHNIEYHLSGRRSMHLTTLHHGGEACVLRRHVEELRQGVFSFLPLFPLSS